MRAPPVSAARRAAAHALAITLATLAFPTPGSAAPPPRDQAGTAGIEGRLLVLNKEADSLMVFEEPSHRLLATVPVGDEPHEVAATPDGKKAFVTNVRDRSVSVVDLGAYRVRATIRSPALQHPHGVQATPDGRWVLVTSESNRRLVLIDAVREVVMRGLATTQSGAHMIALVPGGKRAWVANRGSDSVSLVHLPDLRVARNLRVGPGPEGIAVTPNGRWVVVALQNSDQVVVIDTGSQELVGRLPAGRTPIRVAVAPASLTALISNRGSDDVTVLDLLSRRVKATIPVGRSPGESP